MSERVEDLTGAYALNALTPQQRAEFERRLAESESLRTEALELADTATELGLAVPEEAPPASLREQVLAQIAGTPQLAPPAQADAAQTAAEQRAHRRWFQRPAAMITSVAAAAALVLGGVLVTDLVGRYSLPQQQAAQVAAVRTADDVQQLSGEVTGGGTATLYVSRQQQRSALVVDGLAAAPAGSVYELWYLDDAGARPAGLFSVDAAGGAQRVLDGQLRQGDLVGVTVEPAGGSTAPTTDPILLMASEL